MKKRIIKILWLIDLLLYVFFSYIYLSDGLEMQLAKKGSDLHRVYIHNYVMYSNLYYNSVSIILLKIGLVGMILTALIFAFYGTYISKTWISKKYTKYTGDIYSKDEKENTESVETKTLFGRLRKLLVNIFLVVIILLLYLFILHIIQRYIYINFCMLVGE